MSRSRFGSIERRGHGVYRIQWTENGRRRSKTIHGERRDADLALGRIQGGLEIVGEACTVCRFWEGTVWPSCDGLAAKTSEEYERLYWREIDPAHRAPSNARPVVERHPARRHRRDRVPVGAALDGAGCCRRYSTWPCVSR